MSITQSKLDALNSAVDTLFAEWDKPDSPGVAVAIVQDGKVIFAKGYGIANLEYDVPITPTSVFDIASVSKQFAGMAIAMLVDQGKVALDDDLRHYLPELPDFGRAYNKAVTIRHLVHHTSGIRDWVGTMALGGRRMEDVISFEDILKLAQAQRTVSFERGAEYLYSNTGYNLLARVVEVVSGQAFAPWIESNLLNPLGMNDTHFHADHQRIVKNRADSYSQEEDGTYKKLGNNLMALGSSSLYSTVTDLAKWLINLQSGEVGGDAVLAQMRQRGTLNNGDDTGYAFGLAMEKYRGLHLERHDGSWAGFRTTLVHYPEQKFGVIALSNLASFNPPKVARQVADHFLADDFTEAKPSENASATPPVTQPAADAPSPADLDEFVGRFASAEVETAYTLVIEDGRLVARHYRNEDIVFRGVAHDRFESDTWFFKQMVFERDGSGKVSALRASNARSRNILFVREG